MSVWAKTWAYEQTVGSPGRKSVLVALAEFSDAHGVCRPGQKTLADMTELDERTVRRHLAKLEEDEYIERVHRQRNDGSRTSDETRLLAPAEALVPPSKNQQDKMTGREKSNRTKSTIQPDTVSGPLLNEPSVDPSDNKDILSQDEKPTQVKALTTQEAEEKWTVLLAVSPHADSLRSLAELLAQENKTGKVAITKVWRTIGERFQQARERETISDAAWAHGFTETIAREIPNIGYVLKSARGYREENSAGPGSAASGEEAATRRKEGYEWLFGE